MHLVALKAQGQTRVNAQGKISAFLVAVKQEVPPTGSQVLCRGAAFLLPAVPSLHLQDGDRWVHVIQSTLLLVNMMRMREESEGDR